MKCNIAKDLVSLYAEGLCSEDTCAELEKHLEECEDCKEILRHYRTEINTENTFPEKPSKLEPMKKTSKKLKRNRFAAIMLSVVLIALFGCIGVLSYGEITNRCISFSVIADYFKLKNVTENLAGGNTEPLIEIITLNSERYYTASSFSNFKNQTEYKDFIKIHIDNTYEELFAGRDIDIRLSDFWQESYDYDDSIWNIGQYPLYMEFEFCENDNVIHTMSFTKLGVGIYDIYDISSQKGTDTSFTGNILAADEIIIEILMRSSVRKKYDSIVSDEETPRKNGWHMFVKGIYGSDDPDYENKFRERIEKMYSGNIIPKDTMYGLDRFDDQKGLWIYSVWVEYAALDTDKSFIVRYDFVYQNNKFYVDPDSEPYIISSDAEIDSTVSEMVLDIFTG